MGLSLNPPYVFFFFFGASVKQDPQSLERSWLIVTLLALKSISLLCALLFSEIKNVVFIVYEKLISFLLIFDNNLRGIGH